MTNLFRFIIILLFTLYLSEAKAHEMSLDSLMSISVQNINGGLNQIYKGDPRQAMSLLRLGFDKTKDFISQSNDSAAVKQMTRGLYDESYNTLTFVGYDEVQQHALHYYLANAAECIFLTELRYGGDKYMEHLRTSIEHYSLVDKIEALDIATHYEHIIDSVFSPSSIQSFMMSDIMLEHFGKIEGKDNFTMLYLQKGKKWHKNKMYSDFLFGYIPFLIRSATEALGELSDHPTSSIEKYETGNEKYLRIKLASTKNNANKTHKKEKRFSTYDELSHYVTGLSLKAINQEKSEDFHEAVKTIDKAIVDLMTAFDYKLTDFEIGLCIREFERLLSLRCRFSSTLKDIDNTKKYVSVLKQIFSINDSIGIKAAMMFSGEGNHNGWKDEYVKSLCSIEKKFGKKWSVYQHACMWRAEACVLSPGRSRRKFSLEKYNQAEKLLNHAVSEVLNAEGRTSHYYDLLSSKMMFYIFNGTNDILPYEQITKKLDDYVEELKELPDYEYYWEYISIMYVMVLYQCEKHGDWTRIKFIAEKLYDLPDGDGIADGPYKAFIDYDFFVGDNYCTTLLTPFFSWYYSYKNTMAEYAAKSYLFVEDSNYNESIVEETMDNIQDVTLRWMSYGEFYHQEHIDENLNVIARMALRCSSSEIVKKAFEYTMMCKGIQLYSMDIVDMIARQSGNREIRQLFKEYKDLYLQSLLYEKETGERNNELKSKLDDNSLFLKATELDYFYNYLKISTETILNALENDEMAVEFATCEISGLKKIIAYILNGRYKTVQLVDLVNCDNDILQKGHLIWEGILKQYNGKVNKIFFSPIANLHNMPLEKDIEGYGIQAFRLSNIRELLNREKIQYCERKAEIYGGLSYFEDDNTESSERGAFEIAYLPSTLTETESLSAIFNKSHISNHIVTGKNADEESFLMLDLKNVTVLHVATHGFFYNRPDTDETAMSNTGLLLSGAGLVYPDVPIRPRLDGIVTALEISKMRFEHLDLVTLSACETGLGNVSSEGVFGLQRGFKKAGANSILMSLWKVDDAATCKLMTEFYSNWIGKKMTKHDALEAAKKTVRETNGWEDSKYWAAFILLDGLD